jgi:copper chaperone CopZ
MTTITLTVDGMTCGHCVQHVTEALEAVNGVTSVQVSLTEKKAVVVGEGLTAEGLIRAVQGEGYEAIAA